MNHVNLGVLHFFFCWVDVILIFRISSVMGEYDIFPNNIDDK
jgi:hypothetical protein